MKNHLSKKTGKPFKRGARPSPRYKLAGAQPFRPAASPPAYFFIFPKKLSMWGNDAHGDCVTAEESFNKACNGVFITDGTTITWATQNGVLEGAELQPVIQMMQADGFHQDSNVYGDGGPLAVDYSQPSVLQAAIYQAGIQGGAVKIGIAADQLPSGAGNDMGWFLTSDSPDSNLDHCVGLCGYGTAKQFIDAINAAYGLSLTVPSGVDPTTQGYALYTWSTIGFVTPTALTNMTGEAWLRNPSSVTTGTGTPTPDLVYVSTPTPVPPPVPPTPPTPPIPPTPPVPPGPTPPSPPLPPGVNVVGVSVASPIAPGTYQVVDANSIDQTFILSVVSTWTLQQLLALIMALLQLLVPPSQRIGKK